MLINIPLLRKKIRKLFGLGPRYDQKVKELYSSQDYLDAYIKHTKLRMEEDPQAAIGGRWEEIGRLQYDFLIKNGLKPFHSFLDIGCGTLRGGRYFIRYLDAGCYTGFDISTPVIEHAKKLVSDEGLSDKRPKLDINDKRNLKFEDYHGRTFDYLLAQSVFTHLLPEHIEECFLHVGRVMHERSVFYFTYNEASKFKRIDIKDFCYPFSFFQKLANENGFMLNDQSRNYPHPRMMKMMSLEKKISIDPMREKE